MRFFSCLAFCLVGVILVHSEVTHQGGSCGRDAIPYKVVVDSTGRPEIFCDKPTCFGEDTEYYHDKRKKDEKFLAKCSTKYLETVCIGDDEWTGGLIEINNGTHKTLKTQCCSYPSVRDAKEVKSVLLEAGDVFEGGVVEAEGRSLGFDLIKEIRKTVKPDNNVQYIVAVHRMPCETYGDEMNSEELPLEGGSKSFARNRRRLSGGRKEKDSYDSMESLDEPPRRYSTRSNARRRPAAMAAPRRPYYRRPIDYDYYADYDYVPRRRMYAARRRFGMGENRLWPVDYQPRRRVYASETYDDVDPVVYAGMKNQNTDLLVVDGGQQAVAKSGPTPPPMSNNGLPSIYDNAGSPPAPARTGGYQPSAPLPAAQGAATYTGASAPSYSAYPSAPSYPAYQPAYPASYPSSYVAPSSCSTPACVPASCGSSCGGGGEGGGLNDLFAHMQCFSGDMTVETPSGTKKMSDLEVGDMVLSIDENMVQYSPVIMFLHKIDNEEADFNQINLDSGEQLELTDYHLMYTTDCGSESPLVLKHAKDVKVGECAHLVNGHNFRSEIIRNITMVTRQGIYAPLTNTGDMMVNKALVSCHSNLALKSLQQTFFALHRKAQSVYEWAFPAEKETQYDVPLGVTYITTVMDLFLPKQFF